MTSRKQTKKRGTSQQKNIALELLKARNLNNQLIKQLMVISNSPESEPAQKIIEHYRKVLTQMKNDTIHPDSNPADQTAAVPNSESTSGGPDTEQPIDGLGGDNTTT